ncbi:type II toxin-antitoxin system HicB family antitoxin [Sciscionella sediminilitoris]|uniref:type II toxin-antitoxin system HicB family antitoxin n=1 Tax=Sciscionella sediminilitoris TaxID=1445613 RepID=UPI00056C4D9B|nr:type II toxin-antitoxin system HicB family antitoxin [Sciscionella sp. SE31]
MSEVRIDITHYTYRVSWSPEDGEFVGTCVELPSLSWLADTQQAALSGVEQAVAEAIEDMLAGGEEVPTPLAERRYSGRFNVRVPESLHRRLAMEAAEQDISLNRLISDRLSKA